MEVNFTDLLWWHVKGLCPHVNLLINVNTRDDKEDPRTTSTSREQEAEAEDDRTLILLEASREGYHLDNLHHKEEGEGEGGGDEDAGSDDQEG